MTRSHPPGFLAAPPSGSGRGVLVLHAWWGLNENLKAFCARLARNGFISFAPDLYHGKVADNVTDAEALGRALDTTHVQAKEEIAQAARFLHERAGHGDDGIAVIGFSLGAAGERRSPGGFASACRSAGDVPSVRRRGPSLPTIRSR